jgi:hypothetical protein
MRFSIPMESPAALAVVAAHGAVDVCCPLRSLLAYSAVALPLPSDACTAAFAAGSVAHFAEDVGLVGSVALHVALLNVAIYVGVKSAVEALFAYFFVVHIPLLVVRLALNRDRRRAAVLVAATLVSLHPNLNLAPSGVFLFDEKMQLVVAVHAALSKRY